MNKKHLIPALSELYSDYQKKCMVQGIFFKLTEKRFRVLVQKDCFYCGFNPSFNFNLIECINKSRGFVSNNLLSTCTDCSRLRNDFLSVKETQLLIKVLLNYRQQHEISEIDGNINDLHNTTVYFDVDDTLIKYKFNKKERIVNIFSTYKVGGKVYKTKTVVAPHKQHIRLLKRLKKQNNRIVVWSAAGEEWARLVCRTLKLKNFVNTYLEKPGNYIDDLSGKHWLGKRTWLVDL